jgi:hypothetical protein
MLYEIPSVHALFIPVANSDVEATSPLATKILPGRFVSILARLELWLNARQKGRY